MRSNNLLRVCSLVIIEDNLHVNIKKVIERKNVITQYVCVKHCGDNIQTHYHVYLRFKYRLPITTISKWFVLKKKFIMNVYSSSDLIQYLLNPKDGEESTLICSCYAKEAL